MTPIAIPLFLTPGLDLEEAFAAVEDAGASLVELRADQATEKLLLEALEESPLPAIVTVRPTWEGGKYDGPESRRIPLLEAAMEAGADYVDVELIAWEKSRDIRDLADAAEKSGTRLILSNHSFGGRPSDLPQRLARLRAVKEASLLKLVWKAESILDAVAALQLTRTGVFRSLPALSPQSSTLSTKQDPRPILALAMGEEGLISRLLGAKFGSPFTFASLDIGKESAPGQPTARDLLDLYRWEKQTAATAVFGVIGWPVGHSLSPHIHNPGLAAAGVDGVYVPLAIRPEYESFKAAVDALSADPSFNLRGLSVTIPHKENALRYAQENSATIDSLAQRIGVVNTLVFPPTAAQSSVRALNTDYAGALDALVAAMNTTRGGLANVDIAILGAGGAARAIVAALADNNASVTIYNRTFERAQALAAEFHHDAGRVRAAPWTALPAAAHRVYINCTPLGMHPNTHTCPIDFDPVWTPSTIVFDTVYTPQCTRLLQLAQRKGAVTVTGLEMFVRQAAIQFEAFTAHPAPTELFREVLKARLKA